MQTRFSRFAAESMVFQTASENNISNSCGEISGIGSMALIYYERRKNITTR